MHTHHTYTNKIKLDKPKKRKEGGKEGRNEGKKEGNTIPKIFMTPSLGQEFLDLTQLWPVKEETDKPDLV